MTRAACAGRTIKMGKKRLLALMCAVSILLTTFMPLSALGAAETERSLRDAAALCRPAPEVL